MSRGAMKGLAIALAVVAFIGVAHATLALVVDPCLAFRGQWHWNSASSSVVKTRVQNLGQCAGLVKVGVKARAEDGSTIGGYQYLNVPGGAIREASISLPKRITSLQFTELRFQPANGNTVCKRTDL